MPKAVARKALGLPRDGRVVLHLGRMVPRKGVDTVIRGFARLRKKAGGDLVLVTLDADRQPREAGRWSLPFDVRAVAVDAAADRVYLAAGGEGLGVAALSAVVR